MRLAEPIGSGEFSFRATHETGLGTPEHFYLRLRLVIDEHQPGHLRRLDGDSEQRGERGGPHCARKKRSLAALVDQYAGTLYRVAFSVLRNPADAEDAVQEAFLRVLRHRDTLDEVRDHRVWLIRIVWNIVLDRKRRAKTRPETDDVAELARVLPSDGLSRRGDCRRRAAPRPCAGLR